VRTHRGDHEIDLLLTCPDGRVLAIEVKSSPDVQSDDVRHLVWLAEQLGDNLIDAVVINTGPNAHRRSHDGIAVVPLAALGL
jgi:hypothetical protein